MSDPLKPLTLAEVAEAQKRCDAATPGPFYHGKRLERVGMYHPSNIYGPDGDSCVSQVYGIPLNCSFASVGERAHRDMATASFFAHSRADLPRALETIRRLHAALKHVTENWYCAECSVKCADCAMAGALLAELEKQP